MTDMKAVNTKIFTLKCPFNPDHGRVNIRTSFADSCVLSCGCHVLVSAIALSNFSETELADLAERGGILTL